MKKIIAVILAIAMVFSMATVLAYAEDETTTDGGILTPSHGNDADDEEYEGYYTLMNFFKDRFNRINLLIEYIVKVFFPNVENIPQIPDPEPTTAAAAALVA